jgi:FkbM family methyltransferase
MDLRGYDDWLIYHEIFDEGEYEKALEALCSFHMRSGATAHVLDLGGNIGFFALRCADAWLSHSLPLERLRIVSVEPVLENIRATEALADLNPTLRESWTILQGVVGLRSGVVRLSEGPGHFCSSISSDSKGAGDPLPYMDLSTVCGDWPEISLMKVDIEGSEVDLLESYGDLLAKSTVVCMETHGVGRRLRSLELLQSAGFQGIVIERIVGLGSDELGSIWGARDDGKLNLTGQ